MPNLNEFFKKEKIMAAELEKIGGRKPCFQCDKDADEYFWNATEFILSWTCPDGHENYYRIK